MICSFNWFNSFDRVALLAVLHDLPNRSRINVWQFLVHRQKLLVGTLHGGRGKGDPWRLFLAVTPFMKVPPAWPDCFPKTPPPNTITLGARIQPTNGRVDTITHSTHPESASALRRFLRCLLYWGLTFQVVRNCEYILCTSQDFMKSGEFLQRIRRR